MGDVHQHSDNYHSFSSNSNCSFHFHAKPTQLKINMKFLVALALLAVSAYAVDPEVTVLRNEQEIKEDGSFSNVLELSDGSRQQSSGYIKNPQEPDSEKRIQVIEGSYSFVDPADPKSAPLTVTYVADENGYVASGAHLPTAPPTPDHVVKLLQIINANVRKQREIAAQLPRRN